MADIDISVQTSPQDRNGWLALARRLESGGFAALLVADHPGSGPEPWPALAAAATATDRLRVGTYVVQGGVRSPVHVAAAAASLAQLAPGRVTLGIGAGHTPAEWHQIGQERPSPHDRAGRLVEFLEVVMRLLAGERVGFEGLHLTVRDAQLEDVPTGPGTAALLVGGGNAAILEAAGRHADVVALSGLGRTLPDGHRHEVRWSRAELERQLRVVRAAAATTDNTPVLDALVQVVEITDDRQEALTRLAERAQAPVEDLAETPFVLIGTVAELAEQLRRQAAEFGITSYVVREPAIPAMEAVMSHLAGAD